MLDFQQQIDEAQKSIKLAAKQVGAEDGFIVSCLEEWVPSDFTTNYNFISSIEEIFRTVIEKLNNDGLLDYSKGK